MMECVWVHVHVRAHAHTHTLTHALLTAANVWHVSPENNFQLHPYSTDSLSSSWKMPLEKIAENQCMFAAVRWQICLLSHCEGTSFISPCETHDIRVQEEKEKEWNTGEKMLEEIMARNVPNLAKDIDVQIQEPQQTQQGRIMIMVILLKTKQNKKGLGSSQGKRTCYL